MADIRLADLLWAPPPVARRGPRRRVDLATIDAAAVLLADAEGLEAASMQRVADDVGLTKMALYRYVPGRAELVALMIEPLGTPPRPGGRLAGAAPRVGRRDASRVRRHRIAGWRRPRPADGSSARSSSAGWRRAWPPWSTFRCPPRSGWTPWCWSVRTSGASCSRRPARTRSRPSATCWPACSDRGPTSSRWPAGRWPSRRRARTATAPTSSGSTASSTDRSTGRRPAAAQPSPEERLRDRTARSGRLPANFRQDSGKIRRIGHEAAPRADHGQP